MPHSTTAYDTTPSGAPITGLAAAYWPNLDFAGAPTAHETGLGVPTMYRNFSQQPAPTGTPGNFSVRLTGEINLPWDGSYIFSVVRDGGIRLYVDDLTLIDDWLQQGQTGNALSSAPTALAGGRHRFRIDYRPYGPGDQQMQVDWNVGSTYSLIPESSTLPNYGLATRTVDADFIATATDYGSRPEFAQAVATIADPDAGHLNLTSTTTYEAPGTGYRRRIARTLPKGAATQVSYAYYATSGDTAPANTCSGAVGRGLLKSETDPTPATGAAIVYQYVYDALGRVVGTRVGSDANWSCTAYDSRGRVTSSTDSAAKTTTADYSTPGTVSSSFTDSAGAARTTVSTIDLDGRPISYTDEQATTTTRSYD
ncbi:MAG: hypothetical protein LC713_06955, partial [Actinobacteria bacterium]|nr:hypothetical protein [Actinomycetota bacterium]